MCDYEYYDDGWRLCAVCCEGYTEFYDYPPETGHISCGSWTEKCPEECNKYEDEPLCGACFDTFLGEVLKRKCF